MKEGEIHPPVRAGQSLPGPGGEVLRWVLIILLKSYEKIKSEVGQV